MTATGCSGMISATVSDSQTAQVSTANIECISTSLDIGSAITVSIGYTSAHDVLFTGYVKMIEVKEPSKTFILTCSNVLVRAMDFFIASSDPNTPFTRSNIKAEDLVGDLMSLAGLTNYSGESSLFTLGIHYPIEVNLTSVYDYCRFIADILANHLWADLNGQVHFGRRLPYITGGESNCGTITDGITLSRSHSKSEKDLRNRVVVYGAAGISAEASASSPYLPAGFYKTVVVGAPTVFDNIGMAQQSADYNLDLMNRLTDSLEVTILGDSNYVPRASCTISSSLDSSLNGTWYIFAVNHSASDQGYTTSLDLRR